MRVIARCQRQALTGRGKGRSQLPRRARRATVESIRAARSGVMAARGFDGGAGRLPADDRRPRCADVCMSVTTPRQRRAGARVRRARCPLTLYASRRSGLDAAGNGRQCADACVLVPTHPRQPRSRLRVRRVHRQNRYAKPMELPRTSRPFILRDSSGPSRGRPADDRPGSFGRELAVMPNSTFEEPPEFGSMSQLGALAEWLRSGLQSRLHRFDSGRRLFCLSGDFGSGGWIEASSRWGSLSG
jgi:hypothetical protein